MQVVEGLLDDAVETAMEELGDDEADDQVDEGVDDALAQLFEVLHQAHAGEFCAVGDSFAGPVVSIQPCRVARFLSRIRMCRGCGGRGGGVVEAVGGVYGMSCGVGVVRDLIEHGGERGDVARRWDGAGFGSGAWGGRPVDGGLMESSSSVAMACGSDSADSEAGDGMWGCSGSGMTSPMGRRGSFDGGDLLLAVSLLGDAKLFFHLCAELVAGAAEIGHQLAELAREHGQLLRTEEQQGQQNDDSVSRKPGIGEPMIRPGWAGNKWSCESGLNCSEVDVG